MLKNRKYRVTFTDVTGQNVAIRMEAYDAPLAMMKAQVEYSKMGFPFQDIDFVTVAEIKPSKE